MQLEHKIDQDFIESLITEKGLSRQIICLTIARCAIVKHLSETYPDRFWLKGGTLLYNHLCHFTTYNSYSKTHNLD
jgi:hypothetical protein